MKPLNVYKKRHRGMIKLVLLFIILSTTTFTCGQTMFLPNRTLNCASESLDWAGIQLHCTSCYMQISGGTIYKCTPINNNSVDADRMLPYVEAELLTSRRRKYRFGCWPSENLKTPPGTSAYFYLRQIGNQPSSRLKRETAMQKRQSTDMSDMIVNPRWQKPLIVLKIISLITLAILMAASVLIYLCCGMFYQECLSHMCSELAMVGAYVCLLAITLDTQNMKGTVCACTIILLQYLFQVVFLSLLMETFFLHRLLITCCPKNILSGPVSLLILIWGLPLIITAISGYVYFNEFSTGSVNCWLNVRETSMPVLVAPTTMYACGHVVLLAPLFLLCDVPPHVRSRQFTRAQAALNARWASLAILLMSMVVWVTGFLAENHDSNRMLISFCIFSVILGAFVPCVRVATEDQVRQIIWARIVTTPSKPTGWPMGLFDGYDQEMKQYNKTSNTRINTTSSSKIFPIKPTEITKVMAFSAKNNKNFFQKH